MMAPPTVIARNDLAKLVWKKVWRSQDRTSSSVATTAIAAATAAPKPGRRNGRVWKMPPRKVPPPVIAPRSTGLPRPVRSPVSDSPSEKAMLTPAPRAVAAPVKNAVSGRWVARATAKIGARVDSEPSISPLSAGWTRSSRNDRPPADSGAVTAGAMALMVGSFRGGGLQDWVYSFLRDQRR